MSNTNMIIKDERIVENTWQILDGDTDINALPVANVFVSSDCYLANVAQFQSHHQQVGLLIASNESPDGLSKKFPEGFALFPVIAIDFPVFTDGRGFSSASSLKEHYGFEGELRAIGHFMRDQMYYLKRCGFNAFAPTNASNKDLEKFILSLNDFKEDYQRSVNKDIPLFRRR